MEMNNKTYRELIERDIEALKDTMPESTEKSHIEVVLQEVLRKLETEEIKRQQNKCPIVMD
jgi:hypothetical protein